MTLRHKKMAGRPTKPHLGPVLASQPTSMWPQVLRRYLPGRWGVTNGDPGGDVGARVLPGLEPGAGKGPDW